jgi:hypothetical protein
MQAVLRGTITLRFDSDALLPKSRLLNPNIGESFGEWAYQTIPNLLILIGYCSK